MIHLKGPRENLCLILSSELLGVLERQIEPAETVVALVTEVEQGS